MKLQQMREKYAPSTGAEVFREAVFATLPSPRWGPAPEWDEADVVKCLPALLDALTDRAIATRQAKKAEIDAVVRERIEYQLKNLSDEQE
jgi:hypothetical protein